MRFVIGLFLWSGITAFGQSLFEGRNVMILLNNKDSAQFVRLQGIVDQNDGHIVHAFSPNIIQGHLTSIGEQALCKTGYVKTITDSAYRGDLSHFSARDQMVIKAWNQQFLSGLATRGDADGDNDRTPQQVPGKYQTSEYMMGRVAVGIVFVESDGSLEKSTENWDAYSKEDMFFQIRKGLDWWANLGGYRASLSWTYEFKDITTKYEPITHSYNDDQKWVDDVSGKLGYGSGEGRMICYEYANDLRNRYQTDWAFVIFAVPADNDDDGNWFKSEAVAWANLGGPLLIVNNRCDGWGPENAWQVVAHETGHIFNALDEYKGGSSGDSRTGLLNVKNGNAEDGGVIDEECIMKAHGVRACEFTKGQIGWIDDNFDGIFVSDYMNVSRKFNQKMMLREAEYFRANPSKVVIDFEDPRVRMEAERNKKFYSEAFATNERGWNEDKDSYVRNGAYSISNTTAWLPDEYADFEVSVKVALEKGVTEAFGLDVYSRQTNSFITCVLNPKGEVMAMNVPGGQPYFPKWVKAPGFNAKGANVLTIKCLKKNVTVSVNGQSVGTFTDNATDERSIGLRSDEGVRATFDDLVIKKPQ